MLHPHSVLNLLVQLKFLTPLESWTLRLLGVLSSFFGRVQNWDRKHEPTTQTSGMFFCQNKIAPTQNIQHLGAKAVKSCWILSQVCLYPVGPRDGWRQKPNVEISHRKGVVSTMELGFCPPPSRRRTLENNQQNPKIFAAKNSGYDCSTFPTQFLFTFWTPVWREQPFGCPVHFEDTYSTIGLIPEPHSFGIPWRPFRQLWKFSKNHHYFSVLTHQKLTARPWNVCLEDLGSW